MCDQLRAARNLGYPVDDPAPRRARTQAPRRAARTEPRHRSATPRATEVSKAASALKHARYRCARVSPAPPSAGSKGEASELTCFNVGVYPSSPPSSPASH
jgi:hypothetical protein